MISVEFKPTKMNFIIVITILSLLVLSSAQESQKTTGPLHGKLVVCPVPTQSAIDIIGNKFKIYKADWSLCTHLIALDSKFLSHNDMTERDKEEDYKQLTNLRTKYPHLKIYLGARIHDYYVEVLKVANDKKRLQQFIKGVTDYVKNHHFDGLDFNWGELQISIPEFVHFDKIILLLEKLKESFEQDDTNLLLTSSFSMSKDFLASDFDYLAPTKHLHYVHLLPIDFDMDSLEKYNVSIARNELDVFSIQEKIDNLLESDVPASKIIMGVTFGGIGFYSSVSADDISTFDRLIGYSSICDMITGSEADKWTTHYEEDINLTNAFYTNTDKNKKRTILYGESRMVANQIRFAVRRGLAGAIGVTVDKDDFKGKCPLKNETFYDFIPEKGITLHFPTRKETTFPLLRTINEAITVALDESSQQSQGSASNFLANMYCTSFILFSYLLSSILSN